MAKYTPNGGVVSSKLPVSERNEAKHRSMFGLYRGVVVRSIYPDEKDNITKNRMEYVIRVRGQEYPNAINLREAGGVYNYQERVRKGIEKSFTGQVDVHQFNENLDGEHIFVMFIEGNGDVPLIVGGDNHSRAYKKLKKDDGLVDVEEFNGVEISTDKNSNYVIKQVGRKDVEGKIKNQDAVGAKITLYGATGDIEVLADPDCKTYWTKKDKKIKLTANTNTVVMDKNGIALTDKNKNTFTMASAGVSTTTDGNANVTAKGDAKVTADGNADISGKGGASMKSDGQTVVKGTGGTNVGDSGSPTMVDGQTVALAGGGSPIARIGDMVIGTGNLGAPVISQIIQGSPKVTSA